MNINAKIALALIALSMPIAAVSTSSAQSTAKCSVGTAVNANTASDAALTKLPGVGPKILAEIKDYRPYKNIAQFRKELGKYMNTAALNKLSACVFVK